MEKVYLKYDDIRPYVECDYGPVWEMIYLGALYPYRKKDYRSMILILLVQLAITTIILILVPFPANLVVCLIMIFLINFLFALNYNMIVIEYLLKAGYYPMDYQSSDKLIKKGIYFKLQ